MGQTRGRYKILIGKSEGNGLPGKVKCRWEDNIKMGCKVTDGRVGTGFI
jgi:hypothetical protein